MKEDDQVGNGKKIINITPNASKQGLYEKLNEEAEKDGVRLRHFVGAILENAMEEKRANSTNCKYDTQLKDPLPNQGTPIQCVVKANTKSELNRWAKEKNRQDGAHCAFILEKWFELKKP